MRFPLDSNSCQSHPPVTQKGINSNCEGLGCGLVLAVVAYILILRVNLLLNLTKRGMESQVRQNFHAECEAAVNLMVNLELYASYVYLSLSYYFDRDDVALKHMAQFLKEQSHEEQEHAEKFLKYQNKRGGRIVLQDIKKPERDEWGNSLEALQCALQLEKKVNQALLDLHKLATEKNDPHLCDFLESEYLEEQVKAIKQLGDHVTNLKRLGVPQSGMGEYLFDKLTLEESS